MTFETALLYMYVVVLYFYREREFEICSVIMAEPEHASMSAEEKLSIITRNLQVNI